MAPVDKPAIKIANKIHDLFTPGTGGTLVMGFCTRLALIEITAGKNPGTMVLSITNCF